MYSYNIGATRYWVDVASGQHFPVQQPHLPSNGHISGTSAENEIPLQMNYSFASIPQTKTVHRETPQFPLANTEVHTQQGWLSRWNTEDHTAATPHSFGRTCSTSSIPRPQSVPKQKPGKVNPRDMYDMTWKEKQEIVHLFDNGRSCSHIMRKTKLSAHHIKNVLDAAGRTVVFRDYDRERYNTLRPVVLELFAQGWSPRAIGKHAQTSSLWVDKIIRDAGFTPETPPARMYRRTERTNPWIGGQPDSATRGVCSFDSASGSRVSCSSLMETSQWQYKRTSDTKVYTGYCQEETSIAKDDALDRKAFGCHEETSISEVNFKTPVPMEQYSSGHINPQSTIIEYSSLSADNYVEIPSEMPLLPAENANLDDFTARYLCRVCRLSWHEEEAFLLHLANKEHEQICTTGIFLYCTGCKFRTRKPATMGRHIVKYQSQTTPPNCSMHAIKLETDTC
ncbi:uncharacterized protein LOC129592299 [Paramacrobiotus metropolitanus]|uniref:uncharacterized protein LOC129592299 n=1 Tax=Paramacrobiotus metropolitanus TaxID=2943436 RepID=UPI0024463EDA|nr:uncharacterized protein LOC129592299 [Paramacrobiotus metropolitanus]XP_055344280.1 uncharacterized protein LOC129592299 [Paramacrobiotus metropolitanus]